MCGTPPLLNGLPLCLYGTPALSTGRSVKTQQPSCARAALPVASDKTEGAGTDMPWSREHTTARQDVVALPYMCGRVGVSKEGSPKALVARRSGKGGRLPRNFHFHLLEHISYGCDDGGEQPSIFFGHTETRGSNEQRGARVRGKAEEEKRAIEG